MSMWTQILYMISHWHLSIFGFDAMPPYPLPSAIWQLIWFELRKKNGARNRCATQSGVTRSRIRESGIRNLTMTMRTMSLVTMEQVWKAVCFIACLQHHHLRKPNSWKWHSKPSNIILLGKRDTTKKLSCMANAMHSHLFFWQHNPVWPKHINHAPCAKGSVWRLWAPRSPGYILATVHNQLADIDIGGILALCSCKKCKVNDFFHSGPTRQALQAVAIWPRCLIPASGRQLQLCPQCICLLLPFAVGSLCISSSKLRLLLRLCRKCKTYQVISIATVCSFLFLSIYSKYFNSMFFKI